MLTSPLIVALERQIEPGHDAATLFLSNGAEYPCHVMDIRDGLVFVQTELSKGAVLQSSIIGFTVAD